jgi:hypothetical protein
MRYISHSGHAVLNTAAQNNIPVLCRMSTRNLEGIFLHCGVCVYVSVCVCVCVCVLVKTCFVVLLHKT